MYIYVYMYNSWHYAVPAHTLGKLFHPMFYDTHKYIYKYINKDMLVFNRARYKFLFSHTPSFSTRTMATTTSTSTTMAPAIKQGKSKLSVCCHFACGICLYGVLY